MPDSADDLENGSKLNYEEKFNEIVIKCIDSLHVVSEGSRGELIYCYDEERHVYSENGEQILKALLEKSVIECTTKKVNELLNAVRRRTFRRPSDLVEGMRLSDHSFNPHLVLENCMFNLDTMKPECDEEGNFVWDPDYFITNHMPVKFDPEAKCPKWEKFLNESLPMNDILVLQEALGAILRKEYLTRKFLIIQGPPATGKTTVLNTFVSLLGEDNVSAIPMQRLGKGDKFTLGPIHNKMSNIADDVPDDAVRSIGVIKQLVGRSWMQAERKFGHEFSFINYAFLLFACNILPPISVDEEAFWDRLIMIDFKNFVEPFRRNPELGNELKEELSGILNWGLVGLNRLKEQKWKFSRNETLEEVRQKYISRSEPLKAFVQDCCENTGDDNDYISKDEFFKEFKKYCENAGIKPWTKDRIGKQLQALAEVDIVSDKVQHTKGVERVWRRIKLMRKDSTPVLVTLNLNSDQPVQLRGDSALPPHFFTLDDPYDGDCEYCGFHKRITWRDPEGHHCCRECKESDQKS